MPGGAEEQVAAVAVEVAVVAVEHGSHFVLVGLLRCFSVPYPFKARKITSHQRNSKKGLFVHTSLSTTLHNSPSLSLS